MKYLFGIITLTLAVLLFLNQKQHDKGNIKPESFEMTEEDKALEDSLKAIYRRELYFAAEGTNVDSIRAATWQDNYRLKQSLRSKAALRSGLESFASGFIQATWYERGPNNEAGDMREVDYLPTNDALYAISTVGHLWKGNLNGLNWTLLNDDVRFEPDELEVVPHGTGTRIFAIFGSGVDDKKIRYSDDEGQNWTTGSGFSFYDHWGNGRRLLTLSDNQTLYYLVNTWSGSPWGSLVQLYKTTNKGVSYTKVWESGTGYDGNSEQIDLWKPYDSDQMYLVDNKTQQFYKITHDFGTTATTISAPVSYSTQGVTAGKINVSGRYNSAISDYELFMSINADKKIYKTVNGSTWTYLSTASTNVWRKAWLADPDNTNLYAGGFQINKSTNGTTWADLYVDWWEYYKSTPTKKDYLHVDMMNLDYFKKSNGTPFILILNHSGIHVTYDNFATTKNLGLTNLNVTTLYDQTTASDGFLYCGAQDKGSFKFGGNSKANFNMLSTDNMSTGDGMLGVFFNSDQSFYSMLQNGGVLCFANRNNGNYVSYNYPGTNKPGWINPIVPTPDFTDNKAYVAGGNLTGGSGSYLITADFNTTTYALNNTQFSYDFMANSNNGTSVIKAIGTAQSDFNRIYVSTQDATFFSSTNQGTNWTKHTTAGLPSTMIPWDIKTSNTNANKVFVCGTGFSNTGVYQSNNGGSTFTPLSNSIPLATFFEVALSDNEQYLYAATSAGPYVYVFSTATWHSLMGAETPILDFNTVDNIGNNIIRFGTYGRGVWDFKITNAVIPISYKSFDVKATDNFQVTINWATETEADLTQFEIEKSYDGILFSTLTTVKARNKASQYTTIDKMPIIGTPNYYRIKSLSATGKPEYTSIKSVLLNNKTQDNQVYPNLVHTEGLLNVQSSDTNQAFYLSDYQGRIVMQHKLTQATQQLTLPRLPYGVYMYSIRSADNRQVVKTGKLMIL